MRVEYKVTVCLRHIRVSQVSIGQHHVIIFLYMRELRVAQVNRVLDCCDVLVQRFPCTFHVMEHISYGAFWPTLDDGPAVDFDALQTSNQYKKKLHNQRTKYVPVHSKGWSTLPLVPPFCQTMLSIPGLS